MSVSTEITRLNNAKSAISAAITEKGVTVPSGTKLDGMAPLIKSIPTGGGGGAGSGGTFTITTVNEIDWNAPFPDTARAGEIVDVETYIDAGLAFTMSILEDQNNVEIPYTQYVIDDGHWETLGFRFVMPASDVTITLSEDIPIL